MSKKSLLIITQVILASLICFSSALAGSLFSAQINSDGINVRADSTVTSEIICNVKRGDIVEVTAESYDWCKVRLPKDCPAFIRKDMISTIDEKNAQVIKDRVNIRLKPAESARIIGKAEKGEALTVKAASGDWYKIIPVNDSFGWVHKKFLTRVSALPKKETPLAPEPAVVKAAPIDNFSAVGVIEPYGKIFKRKGTHKLITKDNEVYLLKGNLANLNSLTFHKVMVSGKLVKEEKEKYPVIEVLKLEMLD